jgi:hypothetical protein
VRVECLAAAANSRRRSPWGKVVGARDDDRSTPTASACQVVELAQLGRGGAETRGERRQLAAEVPPDGDAPSMRQSKSISETTVWLPRSPHRRPG